MYRVGLIAMFALAVASCAASPVMAIVQDVMGESVVFSPVFWCLGAVALATTAGAWEACRWIVVAVGNRVRIRRSRRRVIH